MNGKIHLGFREIVIDNVSYTEWKQITINTGATLSTLQDIKVPKYGGCYKYKYQSTSTQNRFILWRVSHDVVEIWEESFNIDFQSNHLQLKFTDTPVLEGLSVHETNEYVVILLVTVASIHRIKLPHPLSNPKEQQNLSIFRDLNFHSLKDYHYHYVLNCSNSSDILPHTASTYWLANSVSNGDALFVLAQNGGALLLVTMTNFPTAVHFNKIERASLINRFFTGFVPTMFRGLECGETASSLVLGRYKGEVFAFSICLDAYLRVWSCSKFELKLTQNVLENTSEAGNKLIPGAERHFIRSTCSDGSLHIAVFLSFEEKQIILIFTPEYRLGQLSLQLVKTLYPPQYDLIDLTITSNYIWSLWMNSKNETKLLYSSISFNDSAMNSHGLQEAFLEPFPEADIALSDSSRDPAEYYLQEIVASNRFSITTLQKALSIYRRNMSSKDSAGRDPASHVTGLWELIEDVEMTLKEEIESRIDEDMSDEDVFDVKVNAWATFYSHILQYHQVSKKVVGLVGVGGDGLVGVMRKESVTWLRPLDALEFLILGDVNSSSMSAFMSTPVFNEDRSVDAAVIAIAQPLIAIKRALYPEVVAAFFFDLYHGELPEQVAASIAVSLLSDSGNEVAQEPLSRVIMNQLNGVPCIVAGFQAYLRALELDFGNPTGLTLDFDTNSNGSSFSAFCSRLGSSIIGAVVSQLAEHRLNLCRDLLLLQQILVQLNVLSPETKNKIYTTVLPQTTRLTQAYFALSKLSVAPASNPTPFNLEASRRQMASLSLNDATPANFPALTHLPSTVLELFILSSGGCHARTLVRAIEFEGEELDGISWSQLLMPLATTVAQLTWPVSKCLLFVEFLVWSNQHRAAQEYIRLLQPWCEWNSSSRKFLFGVSLLNEGETRKAHHMFLAASDGVAKEEFLQKISGGGLEASRGEMQVQYCLKVIRLLEQSGQVWIALEMAKAGIALASVDDPGLAALYSVTFKYHLELEHHDEAFTSLMACPDSYRRKNCLRQLIITLYERKCLSSLVSYNYGTLEPEVITILENRARSADILAANYYDLLFAFHISKQNYKKGACVMYECALRLNKEGLGERGLHEQAKCFLTCINCLRHIPPDQAWITKPILTGDSTASDGTRDSLPEFSNAEDKESMTLCQIIRNKKPLENEVLGVRDIELEFELVHARLKLFKIHPSTCSQLPGGLMNASDTVNFLTHGLLFKDALNICRQFGLPSEMVLEGLTVACIEADASKDKTTQWKWLSLNGIVRDTCDGAAWWTLLRQVLEENEVGLQTHLHKAAGSVLIQRNHPVPAWLYNSYKMRNCGELIMLYLSEGYIEEASVLVVTLIEAFLGKGSKQMNLTHALHSSGPSIWLPYNAIDHLMLELEHKRDNRRYDQIHRKLSKEVEKYQTELERVSYDKFLTMES